MTLEEDPPIRGRYRNVKTVDLYQMDDTGWSALYRPLSEEANSNTAELTLALTLEQTTCELNVQTSHVESSPIPLNEVQNISKQRTTSLLRWRCQVVRGQPELVVPRPLK